MSNRPEKVLNYLRSCKVPFRDYVRSADNEALLDLLKRNSRNEQIVCVSVDELFNRKETAGLSRYVPHTSKDIEALLEPALRITRGVSKNPKEKLILGGEVRRSKKRQIRAYADLYTLIDTTLVNATLTGYIVHPLSDPFVMLRMKRPFEQELCFTLAQKELAFASWQIVAEQALGLCPISPLPDPFQDAAE